MFLTGTIDNTSTIKQTKKGKKVSGLIFDVAVCMFVVDANKKPETKEGNKKQETKEGKG